MPSSTVVASSALYFVLLAQPSAAFTPASNSYTRSSIKLNYRSIHHGPDVEPLTESERLGAYKMNKSLITNFGPGVLDGLVDNDNQFDGGDSEMGLTGDGAIGLQQFGRDVTPHLMRTSARSRDYEPHDEVIMAQSMSYAGELMHSNPNMDAVRAQQLENWAEQREISNYNKHMYYGKTDEYHDNMNVDDYAREYQFEEHVEAGGDYEGIISLRAPLNGIARHDLLLKNPYMGFAEFRAAFVGDTNDWFVTPSDGVLKQHEETHFAVQFRPRNHGITSGYLVIETEDFKKTWKVVGTTGDQYEF